MDATWKGNVKMILGTSTSDPRFRCTKHYFVLLRAIFLIEKIMFSDMKKCDMSFSVKLHLGK